MASRAKILIQHCKGLLFPPPSGEKQRRMWAHAHRRARFARMRRRERELEVAALNQRIAAMCPEERAEYFKYIYQRKLDESRAPFVPPP